MRKLDFFFAIILVPLDYVALLFAGVLAYTLRFTPYVVEQRPVMFALPLEQYLRIAMLVALGWVIIFALSGLYTIGGRRKKLEEFKKIFLASTAAFGGVLAVMVFTRVLFDSRFILVASWILVIMLVWIERSLLRMVQNGLHRSGVGLQQVLIIGKGFSAEALKQMIARNPKFGMAVALAVPSWTTETEQKARMLAAHGGIDQVIVITQNGATDDLHTVLDFADEYHISFRYSADLIAGHGAGLRYDTLAGVPLIELKRTRLEGWGRVYKRIFDIVGSVLLMVLTLPIMVLSALAVLLESGTPVIFKNERAGEHGRVFNTLKFRTMYKKYCVGKEFPDQKNALEYEKKLIDERSDKKGPVYKIKNDPRVTVVGLFLRRTSIDELPQLFNVLLGQMSLVGPRPHQPREVEQYEKHHKRVLEIKPGLTGLPQISGRSDLSFEEEVKLDTYYIEQWSLKLDLIILLKTPLAVLGQRGTY